MIWQYRGRGRTGSIAAVFLILVPLSLFGSPAVRLVVSNDLCLIITCTLDVPPPTTIGSGAAFEIALAALDSGNARDINFAGRAAFSSSDLLATLTPTYTFLPADRGGKGFVVTLRTPGVQTITVSDPANVLAPGTLTMTVTGPISVNVPDLSRQSKLCLALPLGLAGLWLVRLRT